MDHILRFHLTGNSACHHYECWCQGKRLEIFLFWFLITFFLPFYHNMTIMFLFAECFTSLYCGINRHCGIVYSQLFHINGFLWIQLLYSIRIYITWSFSSLYFWRVSLEFLPLSAERVMKHQHCPQLFKRWITLATSEKKSIYSIHWSTMIYLLDRYFFIQWIAFMLSNIWTTRARCLKAGYQYPMDTFLFSG